jgi:hypothetical protein
MPKQHEIEAGESLLSLSEQYGMPSDAIWNDPGNERLRKKRQHRERVAPGDVVSIPDIKVKEETANTDQRHRFIKKGSLGVVIQLDVDPTDASSHDDRFILESTDGAYHEEKTVRDDLVPGDQYVDLHYAGLNRKKRYRLLAVAEPGANPEIVFDNVPYAELSGLSSAAGDEDATEPTSPPGEDAAYPEEPDEEATS